MDVFDLAIATINEHEQVVRKHMLEGEARDARNERRDENSQLSAQRSWMRRRARSTASRQDLPAGQLGDANSLPSPDA